MLKERRRVSRGKIDSVRYQLSKLAPIYCKKDSGDHPGNRSLIVVRHFDGDRMEISSYTNPEYSWVTEPGFIQTIAQFHGTQEYEPKLVQGLMYIKDQSERHIWDKIMPTPAADEVHNLVQEQDDIDDRKAVGRVVVPAPKLWTPPGALD